VLGEGGVGKTRLLTEAAAEANRLGLAVLTGRSGVAGPSAFGVLAEALRSWLRAHRTDPRPPSPLDRGLRMVVPEWPGDDLGAPGLSDSQLRLLALEGVVQLVRDIATTRGGALLVLDDLHAADPESLEAIRYLAAAALPGVLIVGALRSQEAALPEEVMRALDRDGDAELWDVEPLDRRGVADLLGALLDAEPPDPLVAEVLERTDGVPLLVEEVLDAHLRAGSIDVDDRGIHWRGATKVVPPTVVAMVERRLEGLTSRDRDVIVAGAVLGDFDPPLLGRVAGQTPATVGTAVAAAVNAGLLETVRGSVEFRHAVIGEAVRESALPHTLRSLHARAAVALADAAADDVGGLERRAHHLVHAGASEQAADLLARAAVASLGQHAPLRAEVLARSALELAPPPESSDLAWDALARAVATQGRWSEALALDQAAAEEHGETPVRRRRMARCALDARLLDIARGVADRATQEGDDSPLVTVLIGRLSLSDGDVITALACAERALAAASQSEDAGATCAAIDLQARAFDGAGRRDEAEAAYRRQAEVAASAGLTDERLHALVSLGELELLDGQPPEGLQAARELARASGAFVEQAWAELNLSIALTVQGDPAAGARVASEGADRCRSLRLDLLPFLVVCHAGAQGYLGGESFEALLAEAQALAPDTVDMVLHARGIAGDHALHTGQYEEAVGHLQACVEAQRSTPGGLPMDSPYWLVFALAALGRHDEARRALDEARDTPDVARLHTRPVILAAAEALLAGDEAAVEAAIASATGRMPIDLALIRVLGAEILRGPARARWLREALDTYEACGAGVATDRVRRLLRDAGGAVPRRRSQADVPAELIPLGVTAREAEVLQLVQERCSNAEIATRLFISVRTVESHVSSLLTKLQVESRSQLTA
jgi:DNA-binding CsgD family transcriptional regulator/tetratricopeptide (TPR) repeat protein